MEDLAIRGGTSATDDMAARYSHIPGWGHDADPENDPTYPMKNWTGDDHNRIHYEREPQQPETVEILKSIERPELSRVFGTSSPPSGLSGMIRRFAFKFSESTYAHWFPLVLADRINVIEGYLEDFSKGIVPNPIAERGLTSEWKYNREAVIKNIVVAAAVTGALIYMFSRKSDKKKLIHNTWPSQTARENYY
jgi:hypothetical protein